MRNPLWRNNSKDWGLVNAKSTDYIKEAAQNFMHGFDYLRNKKQYYKIRRILNGLNKKYLSIGSGKILPENWIGFDTFKKGNHVFPVNLLFPFPIEDSLLDGILAEHILEHFFFDDIFYILEECYRVLKKDGCIRIISPNAENVARLILFEQENDCDVKKDCAIHRWKYDEFACAKTINRISHQWGEHKSLLTAKMIKSVLVSSKFKDTVILHSEESRYFDRIPDIHHKRFGAEREGSIFIIEARK